MGGAWRYRLPQFRNLVSTLNATLIKEDDFLDLSNRQEINLAFPTTKLRAAVTDRTRSQLLYTLGDGRTRIPFPENCKGFMYYHTPLRAAPLEGSLRFRLTEHSDPASFKDGADLRLPSGAPWQVILPQMTSLAFSRIHDQLLNEGLITQALLDRCRAVFGVNHRRAAASTTLFRLDQEFPVDFASSIHLSVVGDDALHKCKFPAVFVNTINSVRLYPWAGTALARWEPSTNYEYIEARRRILHLRIAKIIEPVRCTVEGYDGRLLQPEEGDLLTVRAPGKPAEPWAVDLDSKAQTACALRILWDAAGYP
ncbi:hypothetical protein DFH06DRAFT_1233234 [Mycena polygramma]|nr:hypothetical protein DFH06DRAFT_1233234 [Mycena polygramma]